MKIFSTEQHMLTRGAAAVFAGYLLNKEIKKEPTDRDDVVYYGSAVMLGFDLYTLYMTISKS